jgi:hypothetical protein
MEYAEGSSDAPPSLAHSLIDSASRLRKQVALNGTTDFSLNEKREIADGVASVLATAARANIMTWGSRDLVSAMAALTEGRGSLFAETIDRGEDMLVDDEFFFTPAPPPPPVRAMTASRPLPRPPPGARGGPAFKGRGIPPPPLINLGAEAITGIYEFLC